MTLVPNHVLLGAVARERQARLQATASTPRPGRLVLPMRVRVGRMLISVGSSLSGDCLERRVRNTAARQAA